MTSIQGCGQGLIEGPGPPLQLSFPLRQLRFTFFNAFKHSLEDLSSLRLSGAFIKTTFCPGTKEYDSLKGLITLLQLFLSKLQLFFQLSTLYRTSLPKVKALGSSWVSLLDEAAPDSCKGPLPSLIKTSFCRASLAEEKEPLLILGPLFKVKETL